MENNIHSFAKRNGSYLRYPLIFAAAVIVAASETFGTISPLTVALIGSLSGGDTLFALLGTAAAFLFKGQIFEAIPTLSIMLVVGAFRFLLGGGAGSSAKVINIASAILTSISVAIVGVTSSVRPAETIAAITAAVLCGVLSYCLMLTYRCLAQGRLRLLTKSTTAAAPGFAAIFAVAVLVNFSQTLNLSLNAGIIVGAVAALAAARKYSYAGGSAAGILTAAGVIIAAPELSSGMVVFAAAATASAVFAHLAARMSAARVTQAAGFVFAAALGTATVGFTPDNLSVIASAAAGSILYIIFPIDTIFSRAVPHQSAIRKDSGSAPSEIFSERLRLAGGALSDVKSAIQKAGEILDKRNTKDLSWVYNAAGDIVCRKCKHNMMCWGEEYNDTVRGLNKLTSGLRKGEPLSENGLPANLAARCTHTQELLYALQERHREYVTINSANRKIAEMRTVLTAQLSATENLMLEMSDEFADCSHYDRTLASRVEKILSENGITRPRVAVMVTPSGDAQSSRISIEGYGKGKLTCDDARLGDLVSEVLQKQFDLPETINSGESFRFTMYERAVYAVEYGAHQLSKSGERSCGDYYESFVDGKGYAYIILSDGMGSGSRARIDSAFACGMLVKLLRAGIGLTGALEIINNSLLVKSSDESFATLDICRIDLYTGKTELFKAGAAPSYIRCNKRIIKANASGLPVGIGHKAVYECKSFTIGNADMVIMASDGAELNEKWLEHELNGRNKDVADLNETARVLATTARYAASEKNGDKNREDDISVIAVKLVK
ncbi:MAG: SpoIIE family protein phosphatase [Oscillospiraceae bacterium]|nr:SpoIIE family protein phosphatase [Oscillospiraceae bacterium]